MFMLALRDIQICASIILFLSLTLALVILFYGLVRSALEWSLLYLMTKQQSIENLRLPAFFQIAWKKFEGLRFLFAGPLIIQKAYDEVREPGSHLDQ